MRKIALAAAVASVLGIITVTIAANAQATTIIGKTYDDLHVARLKTVADSETKAAYRDVSAVLKKVFGKAKLVEHLQQTVELQPSSYLIFVVNKEITSDDMDSLKENLIAKGYKTSGVDNNPLTLTYGVQYSRTVIIHATENDEGRAVIRVLVL